MDKVEIIVLVAVLIIVSLRLYEKYLSKDKDKKDLNAIDRAGTVFSQTSKDEDYKPYLKR